MKHFENINNAKIPGYAEATGFFRQLSNQTVAWLKKYYDHFEDENKEHGFVYQEQQIKTFLTLALGQITKDYCIQEHPTERLSYLPDEPVQTTSHGLIDYWATCHPNSYLVEVKYSWMRYFPTDKSFTFYSHINKRLASAIAQIRSASNKKNFNYSDHLFGMALVTCPIFHKTKADVNTPRFRIDKSTMQNFNQQFTGLNANICAVWSLPESYLIEPDEINDQLFQYVGLAFIGKLIKLTKSKT